jgi:hypothetical protein
VADATGAPLIGANVDATVTRQDLPETQAVGDPIPLPDQSGTYDGVYTQTENPGEYTFNISVSDFTGTRFLPCSAEAKVIVRSGSSLQCTLETDPSGQTEYGLNEAIILIADVRSNGQNQPGATVIANVQRPSPPPTDTLNFSGNGPYTGVYTRTDLLGLYTFTGTARDPNGRTVTCSPTLSINVSEQSSCQVAPLQFDKSQYTLGDTMRLTATITNISGATPVATATIQIPNDGSQQIPLSCNSSGICTGSFTPTVTGAHTFTVTARDQTGQCTPPPSATRVVNPPSDTAIVKVNPTVLTTTLCSERVTSNVTVDNVSSLVGVDLELSYDPTVIQVIDADRTRPGVQVKFDSFIVEDVSLNVVDTARGKIFFSASLLDGRSVNGPLALIGIDWRPQNVGNSAVTLIDAGVVLTGSGGQTISRTLQNGAVQVNFVPNCKTGTAALQGRTDHSGVVVASSAGEQVQTDVDGYFAIIAEDSLSLTFPGYLSGQANFNNLNISQIEGQATRLGAIIILAGDVNGDSLVDILDLAYLAQRYQSSDLTADLNADGLVDILDLALVAGNYQRQGPLTTWQ